MSSYAMQVQAPVHVVRFGMRMAGGLTWYGMGVARCTFVTSMRAGGLAWVIADSDAVVVLGCAACVIGLALHWDPEA